ncbi:hypothetical protein HELRODRAFT_169572 [Helobdella robusta]|uniref:Tyrosine-protein phosphatase domain-containing protein n=1 Tax=Helobdella robusta TaxID=6412 RepID=T1F242_HELRO|nr:hypothetical protein HELRODRAFT_169572 [Helobdella robusta]ESO07876.1 hypothetical protein HELRODRAFT_169572 [Helobdella robusta]
MYLSHCMAIFLIFSCNGKIKSFKIYVEFGELSQYCCENTFQESSLHLPHLLMAARNFASVNFTWQPQIVVDSKPFRKYNLKICKKYINLCLDDKNLRYQYDHSSINFTYLAPSSCYFVFAWLGSTNWNYSEHFCTRAFPLLTVKQSFSHVVQIVNKNASHITFNVSTRDSTEIQKSSHEDHFKIFVLGVFEKDQNVTSEHFFHNVFTADLKLCHMNPGVFYINDHIADYRRIGFYTIDRSDLMNNYKAITLNKLLLNETRFEYHLWIGHIIFIDGAIDIYFSKIVDIQHYASTYKEAVADLNVHFMFIVPVIVAVLIIVALTSFLLIRWKMNVPFKLINSNENNTFHQSSTYMCDLLHDRKNFKTLEEEFYSLQKPNPQPECLIASLPENLSKNRYKNYFPFDQNRVVLPPACCSQSDYINASFISTLYHFNKFITAQCPLPNTVEDFWTMIWVNKISILILLGNFEETFFFKYWPKNLKKEVKYNSMNVKLLSVVQTSPLSFQHIFKLQKGNVQLAQTVEQWSYSSWTPELLPGNFESFSSFIMTLKIIFKTNKSPVAVVCDDGSQKCSLFLATVEATNHLARRGVVDIPNIVNKLRSQRAHSIDYFDQYCTIYEILHQFIKSGYFN